MNVLIIDNGVHLLYDMSHLDWTEFDHVIAINKAWLLYPSAHTWIVDADDPYEAAMIFAYDELKAEIVTVAGGPETSE